MRYMSEKSIAKKPQLYNNESVAEYFSIKDVPRERTDGLISHEDRQLLALMEKINPCHQRYYLGKNALLITYRQKIDLLSFLSWGRLGYTLRIVGFPISIVKKGYYGDPREVQAMIRSLKGFTLVLNGGKDLKLPRGYTLSSFKLSIPDQSFDNYLSRMRSPYRYRLNKALKKRSLYRVRKIPKEAFNEGHYQLYKDVYQRSEAPLECLPLEFFKEMPGEILVFEEKEHKSWQDGRLLGFLFLSYQQDTLNFLFGGFAEADVAKYDLYFGMLTEMVKVAIDKGLKYLELGQTAEESKAKLGAMEQRKYLYLSHKNSLVNKIIPRILRIGTYQPGKHTYRVFKED